MPSALFVLNADGRVLYANALAASLVRQSPESVLGCDMAQEFGHLLSAHWGQACQTARSEQRTVEYELYNVALAGWFRLSLTPVEDNLVIHVKDTTEVNRMMQLQQFGAALASCVTPDEVIEVTLSQAVSTMGAYLGAVFGLNLNGENLELVGNVGYPDILRATAKSVPLAEDFPPCEAVRTGKSVFLVGDALNQRYVGRAEIRSAQTRSLASLPLLVEERALGVLVLSFQVEQTFGLQAREFMLAFALQCAQALDRVRGRAVIEESRERLAFLAAASALLSSSLDIHHTLERLGQLAVEEVADWATIFLADETGQLQLTTAVHRDPDQLPLLNALMDHFPLNMEAQHGVTQVYRTGRSSLVGAVETTVIDAIPDVKKREILRAMRLESLMTVPLTTHGRVIGVMALASSNAEKAYGPQDLELAEELARRAAGTIENAQLFSAAQDGAARLAGIIGTVTDAVIASDEEGTIVVFNTAAEQMFGLEASVALGQSLDHFRPSLQTDEQLAPASVRGTVQHRMFAERANGAVFPVEETTSEVVVRGQRLRTTVLRDVTERLQTEQTLRESEARFRTTFDQAAVGIAHVSLDGRWQNVNQRLCDIVGYSREEMLALAFPEMTYEDDLEEDLEYVDQLRSGNIRTYSMRKRFYRKGGDLVWVNVTGSLMRDSSDEALT